MHSQRLWNQAVKNFLNRENKCGEDYYYIYWFPGGVGRGHRAHKEVRGQFVGVGSFFQQCESWELNQGCRAWWQTHYLLSDLVSSSMSKEKLSHLFILYVCGDPQVPRYTCGGGQRPACGKQCLRIKIGLPATVESSSLLHYLSLTICEKLCRLCVVLQKLGQIRVWNVEML